MAIINCARGKKTVCLEASKGVSHRHTNGSIAEPHIPPQPEPAATDRKGKGDLLEIIFQHVYPTHSL